MDDLQIEIQKALADSTPNFADQVPTPRSHCEDRRRIAGFGILILGGIAMSAGHYVPPDWRWVFLFGGMLYASVGVVMITRPARVLRPASEESDVFSRARCDVRRFPHRQPPA